MRREHLICGLLALMTFALFAPTLNHGFISFDDPVYVTSNAEVQKGLTWESIGWAFRSTAGGNYWHPMTWLSHLLDCQLFGLKPWGHHLTSLLLHAINTALLFLVLSGMTGAWGRSFFVAALFGLHPLHVESVAWVAERKDVLSTFFWMLMMLAYVRYANELKVHSNAECGVRSAELGWGQRPRPKVYYGLTLFCFALGLMSKPMLVTAPFVLLLLDYWPLRRIYDPDAKACGAGLRLTIDEPKGLEAVPAINASSAPLAVPENRKSQIANRKLIWEKVPFFLLGAVISVAAYVVQKNGGAVLANIPLAARLENAVVSYCRYIGKLFCPTNLAIFYPHPGYWPKWVAALAALALLLVTIMAFTLRRRAPYLIVGWLWFIGCLVPTIGLVQAGAQAMADRYTYVPAIGLFIMLVWGISELVTTWRVPRWLLPVAGPVVISGCMVITSVQLSHWKNSETLFRHAIEVTSNNHLAYTSLGDFVAIERGRVPEGIVYLRHAVKLAPDYAPAHLGLGYALWAQGKLAEAASEFSTTLQYTPGNVETRLRLARILVLEGKLDEAIPQYLMILQLAPDHIQARLELAETLTQQHKTAEAISHYREVLRLDPNSFEALNNLAWILATSPDDQIRNGAEAVQLAERACVLTGDKSPTLIGTLAAAYAEAGRFKEAVQAGEKAYQLALASTNAALAETNQKLIELYRANHAYREASEKLQSELPTKQQTEK